MKCVCVVSMVFVVCDVRVFVVCIWCMHMVYMYVHVCAVSVVCVYFMVPVWRLKENLEESVLSLYHVDLREVSASALRAMSMADLVFLKSKSRSKEEEEEWGGGGGRKKGEEGRGGGGGSWRRGGERKAEEEEGEEREEREEEERKAEEEERKKNCRSNPGAALKGSLSLNPT